MRSVDENNVSKMRQQFTLHVNNDVRRKNSFKPALWNRCINYLAHVGFGLQAGAGNGTSHEKPRPLVAEPRMRRLRAASESQRFVRLFVSKIILA
jgi:hypothetical protein